MYYESTLVQVVQKVVVHKQFFRQSHCFTYIVVQQLWAGVTTKKLILVIFSIRPICQPRVSRSSRHTQVMLQTVTLFYIHCDMAFIYQMVGLYATLHQSFSDPAISSESDPDWSPKFGLGLGLGLKKSWISYTMTQNYQSMKYLWRFNYSRYMCMWLIKGIIGFKKEKI
jgi:hypothetical protein